MKSFLVSLFLIAFTQTAGAVDLGEVAAKKLYKVLASYGLRVNEPALLRTNEWAKPAKCIKSVEDGLFYQCSVHDQFNNTTVHKTGSAAKKLYDILAFYKGKVCSEDGRCSTASKEIKCIYHWTTKDYHPEIIYWCSIE